MSWRYEPIRHSLASKGIKSAVKDKITDVESRGKSTILMKSARDICVDVLIEKHDDLQKGLNHTVRTGQETGFSFTYDKEGNMLVRAMGEEGLKEEGITIGNRDRVIIPGWKDGSGVYYGKVHTHPKGERNETFSLGDLEYFGTINDCKVLGLAYEDSDGDRWLKIVKKPPEWQTSEGFKQYKRSIGVNSLRDLERGSERRERIAKEVNEYLEEKGFVSELELR